MLDLSVPEEVTDRKYSIVSKLSSAIVLALIHDSVNRKINDRLSIPNRTVLP